MRTIGDYSAYNRMVADYNRKVREYNQELDTFNEISGEYSRLAERYNYIIGHEHDREGTYRTLFGSPS